MAATTPSTISRLTFLAALASATYLTRTAFHAPNPPPSNRHKADSVMRAALGPYVREYIVLALCLAHIARTAAGIPSTPTRLCPHPSNLNPALFTWTRTTAALLALIHAAAGLRIAAFRTLGSSFTFELAPPNKLITTGVYAWMQHPSYVPDGLLTVTSAALFGRADGAVGAYLPPEHVRWLVKWRGLWLGMLAANWVRVIWFRVREEEEMLREAFGEEWEDWHKRTARFVPGVF